MHEKKIKPFSLKKGDNIGIVAPSFHFNRERFLESIDILKRGGLTPLYFDDIYSKEKYFAGNDERRAEEIIKFIKDKNVQGIWCVRGGFGVMKIIDKIKRRIKKLRPFLFIGFSDITAIHNLFGKFYNMVTIHGPNLNSLSRIGEKSRKFLQELIFGADINELYSSVNLSTIKEGEAEGVLVGGNLSLITSLMGTPFEIPLKKRILLIEDYGEKAYRIDRMLTQISLHPHFNKLRGVVFGSLIPQEGEKEDIEWVMEKFSEKIDGVVLKGLPCGHSDENIPIALNLKVKINSRMGKIIFLEKVFNE